MSDLSLLRYYLGIEVHQEDNTITLKKASYAAKIVDKAGLTGCNPVHISMEPRLKLRKENTCLPVDRKFSRSVVGSLLCLVHSRPDISFAVGFVSRFMEAPTIEDWAAVKQLLCDADFAGDVDDGKSTFGTVFVFGTSVVSWQSQKQKVIALSSCEAEYMAATTAACTGVWLRRMLGDLLGDPGTATPLLIDNKSTIQLCKNHVFHDRTKHIETRFHFIHECVQDGRITVDYVHTGEQLADIMTKAMPRVKFQELREKLGMVDISS